MAKVSKKNPLISVVVPVYKVESYICKCVDSIINQTYKNLEIILVDDGSPDNCGKICDDYAKKDKRIKVIHKKNGGLSDARNAGIEIFNGEYITFVDSDDYISDDYVSHLYSLLNKKQSSISICNVKQIWNQNDIKADEHYITKTLNKEKAFENLLFSQGIDVSACGKLYKKELWKDIRYPKGETYEDSATTYKLIALSNYIEYSTKSCYYYIAREGSISKQKIYNKNEEYYIKNTDQMLDYIRKNYKNLSVAVDRYFIYSRIRILRMLIVTKPRNKQLEKKYVSSIKKIQMPVLKNKKTPKRDKIAIISLKLGMPIFKTMWLLYCRITKRIT